MPYKRNVLANAPDPWWDAALSAVEAVISNVKDAVSETLNFANDQTDKIASEASQNVATIEGTVQSNLDIQAAETSGMTKQQFQAIDDQLLNDLQEVSGMTKQQFIAIDNAILQQMDETAGMTKQQFQKIDDEILKQMDEANKNTKETSNTITNWFTTQVSNVATDLSSLAKEFGEVLSGILDAFIGLFWDALAEAL